MHTVRPEIIRNTYRRVEPATWRHVPHVVHTHMHTRTHARTCAHTHTNLHTLTRMCAHTCTGVYTHAHTCARSRTDKHTHTHTQARIHTSVHARVEPHAHTYAAAAVYLPRRRSWCVLRVSLPRVESQGYFLERPTSPSLTKSIQVLGMNHRKLESQIDVAETGYQTVGVGGSNNRGTSPSSP